MKNGLLLFLLLPLCMQAQSDAYRMTFTVADHVLVAEPCKQNMRATLSEIESGEKALLKGNFKGSRYYFFEALRTIRDSKNPNKGDNTITIDVQKVLKTNDKRLKVVKLSESVPLDKLDRNEAEDFTRTLNDLGIYYHSIGLLNLADLMFTKAIQAQGKALGKTSQNYVCTLHNLGNLRRDQGRYSDADQIFNYVLNYYGKTSGRQSCEYVIALNNRIQLDLKTGRLKRAEAAFAEIEAIDLQYTFLEDSFDPERLRVNKALFLRSQGKEEEAMLALNEVKAIYELEKHKRHPDYYDVLLEMAVSPLSDTLSMELSMEVLDELINDIEKDYTSNSAYYARALKIKANRLAKQGMNDEALALYQQIAETYKNTYYDRHPDYLNALIDQAQLEWRMQQTDQASSHLQSAMKGYQFLIKKEFPSMSETEQRTFWLQFSENIKLFQGFALEQLGTHPELMETAYNLEINTKGLILNNTKKVREDILNGSDAELKAKLKQWLDLKENLSFYYSAAEGEFEDDELDIAGMEEQALALEKELYQRSKDLSSILSSPDHTWQNIQAKLKDKEALVEIMRVDGLKGDVEYIGVIIRKTGGLNLMRIGKAEKLEDEAFKNYRMGVMRRKADVQSYKDFWQPMQERLAGIEQVYLAQDGVYSTVNVAGLKVDEQSFVIDRTNVTVLSNSRAFLQVDQGESSPGSIYLFGNPDYSKNYMLSDLPGTEKEVKAIHAILDSNEKDNSVYLLAEATEDHIKALKNIEVLHVASHGFFEPAPRRGRALSLTEDLESGSKNPMLRSGLLLAGAWAESEDAVAQGKEDGVLTAFEVMNLDLRSTRMVILSACETGLGDIVDGEGVYGLTRAFNVAGADLVLASLWEVDDYTTFQLMTETYRGYARTGDIKSAFLNAQLKIKEKRPDPSYWGAFVLIEN